MPLLPWPEHFFPDVSDVRASRPNRAQEPAILLAPRVAGNTVARRRQTITNWMVDRLLRLASRSVDQSTPGSPSGWPDTKRPPRQRLKTRSRAGGAYRWICRSGGPACIGRRRAQASQAHARVLSMDLERGTQLSRALSPLRHPLPDYRAFTDIWPVFPGDPVCWRRGLSRQSGQPIFCRCGHQSRIARRKACASGQGEYQPLPPGADHRRSAGKRAFYVRPSHTQQPRPSRTRRWPMPASACAGSRMSAGQEHFYLEGQGPVWSKPTGRRYVFVHTRPSQHPSGK